MWLHNVPMQHWAFGGRPNWSDCYWVHARTMRLFGQLEGSDARNQADVLYRVEPGIGSGRVLVQSTQTTNDPAVLSVDLTSGLGRLEAGDRVGLRVKVNTAKTVNLDKGGRVVRVRQARAEEEIPGWFTERVSGAFADVLIGGLESGVERQRKVPIAVATIDATAVVADPEMMMRLVEEGLGKAKAFGCGLISVRPLRT